MKQSFWVVLCGGLLTMTVCFYNGYPLVTNDTGAYIAHGFDFRIPFDRPPYYGLFIRATSLWTSLWLPVFIQCFLISALWVRLTKLLLRGVRISNRVILCSLILITTATCLPWVIGQLMPDAFTGILLVAILLLYFDANKLYHFIFYGLIIFLSLLFHNSHVLIVLSVSFAVTLVALRRGWHPLVRRSLVLVSFSLAAIISICSINYEKGHGFRYSLGDHVFIMGRLAETGILNKYLDENCERKRYRLCDVKHEISGRAWDFIWQANGPFEKTGGWENSEKEYDAIIADVFTTPRYLAMFVQKAIIASCRQMTEISLPSNFSSLGSESSPAKAVKLFFSDEYTEYITSRQNSGVLDAAFFNKLHFLFFAASCLFLLFNARSALRPEDLQIYLVVLLFIVANAFVTASFANVLDRLQHRVFWVLPAINALILMRGVLKREQLFSSEKLRS